MRPFLPVARLVGNGQACRVIGVRCKAAQAVGIEKRLRLLDDLLMLTVSRAELFYPSVKTMLDSMVRKNKTTQTDLIEELVKKEYFRQK